MLSSTDEPSILRCHIILSEIKWTMELLRWSVVALIWHVLTKELKLGAAFKILREMPGIIPVPQFLRRSVDRQWEEVMKKLATVTWSNIVHYFMLCIMSYAMITFSCRHAIVSIKTCSDVVQSSYLPPRWHWSGVTPAIIPSISIIRMLAKLHCDEMVPII